MAILRTARNIGLSLQLYFNTAFSPVDTNFKQVQAHQPLDWLKCPLFSLCDIRLTN